MNPSRVRASFAKRVCEKYRETKIIYADGSKNDELVGIGMYSKDYKEFHRLGIRYLVFSVEVAVISKPLAHLRSAPLLLSDSASVLDALQSHRNKYPCFQEIQELLNKCQNEVTFMWVPWHSCINWNKEADSLGFLGLNSVPISMVCYGGKHCSIWESYFNREGEGCQKESGKASCYGSNCAIAGRHY